MRTPEPFRRFWLALLLSVLAATPAAAQGSARSMDFDVSIRSAAMGGASNALFWGEELNHWGNPALLGYAHTVRYEHARTQLLPDFTNNIFIESDVVKVGAFGAGLVFSGQPLDKGGVDLTFGANVGRDDQGNIFTFVPYETVDSWGFGVSLVQGSESLGRLLGAEPAGWSRTVDVSFGMNFKDVEIGVAPASAFGVRSTTARDFGVAARWTPIDRLESAEGLPLRLDLAYGGSILSYNDNAVIRLPNEDEPRSVTRHRRHGVAARLALGKPDWSSAAGEGVRGSFLTALVPIASLGLTADWASLGAGDAVDFHTAGQGIELTIANLVSGRFGHYQDKNGLIDGPTGGWEVSLPLAGMGGASYEEAWFPEAQDLSHLHRKSYAVWLDPMGIWRTLVKP